MCPYVLTPTLYGFPHLEECIFILQRKSNDSFQNSKRFCIKKPLQPRRGAMANLTKFADSKSFLSILQFSYLFYCQASSLCNTFRRESHGF